MGGSVLGLQKRICFLPHDYCCQTEAAKSAALVKTSTLFCGEYQAGGEQEGGITWVPAGRGDPGQSGSGI